MDIKRRSGAHIKNYLDWEDYFTKELKKSKQWKQGHSAQELATCWFDPTTGVPKIPAEYVNILKSHPDTANYGYEIVIPECPTAFDVSKAGPREHDLLISCKNNLGNELLIGVEAKVDEPLDDSFLYEKLIDSLSEKIKNPKSMRYERTIALSEAILDLNYNNDKFNAEKNEIYPSIIRYQLLTALAGVLAEKKRPNKILGISKCSKYILLIHQLIPKSPTPAQTKSIKRNELDVKNFTKYLHNKVLVPGTLYGPYKIEGLVRSVSHGLNFSQGDEYYIGKIESFF